jgi:hypothetical protein
VPPDDESSVSLTRPCEQGQASPIYRASYLSLTVHGQRVPGTILEWDHEFTNETHARIREKFVDGFSAAGIIPE